MTIPLPDLPHDLIEEILCFVPATYLKRLRSTCKTWNRLIKDDREFSRKHSDKAAKQFPVLMTNDSRICPVNINLHDDGTVPSVEVKSELSLPHPNYDNNLYQFNIDEVFHCDGFLLCNSEDGSRFVVWNPLTGETRWFRPNKKGRTFVLGYDSDSCYKILSYDSSHGNNSEMYEFDTDSWRVLDGSIAPVYNIGYFILNGVSLKGNTYWLAKDRTKPKFSLCLVKFDFSTEKAVHVPLPYQFTRFHAIDLSVVRDEKLSVLLQRRHSSETEIWVTNKIDETTKVVSWTKVLALTLSPELQIGDDATFLLDEEKKVLVYCDRCLDLEDETLSTSKVVIYIVGEDNEVTNLDFGVDTMDLYLPAIFYYVPSLVQLEQAEGKSKAKR